MISSLLWVASSLVSRSPFQLQYGIATERWVGPGNEARLLLKGNPAYCLHLNIVSFPDLIQHIFTSSIMCRILKVICAGVGFGSGTETNLNSTLDFQFLMFHQ